MLNIFILECLSFRRSDGLFMNQTQPTPEIGMALTGASGIVYGFRVLEELLARHVTVHLTVSPNAKHIAAMELNRKIDLSTGRIEGIDENLRSNIRYYHVSHVGAAPASGSFGLRAVAVVPCSMGTLARIATGTSDNLIGRMADVALKEHRPLVLVPRETPYNSIQLKNMLTLSQAGAVIMPASPGFYHHPQSIDELVNFVVARVLQHLGFEAKSLIKGGWGEDSIARKSYLNSNDT